MHCLDGCLMISTVVGYVSSTFEGGRMGDNLEFFGDRKSTRLNSSHLGISYAVFCLKKKKKGLDTRLLRLPKAVICREGKRLGVVLRGGWLNARVVVVRVGIRVINNWVDVVCLMTRD